MRIGLFGNTNNNPLLLALGLRELGHDAVLVVNRKEMVHRPESKFPDFERRYPEWILDCSNLTEGDFVWVSPRLEHELKGVRQLLLAGREYLADLPAFQEIVERHKEAADLVADIIVVDRDSIEAPKEAEQARRVAAQSLEQGESTLAAYRRVVSPGLTPATLVKRRA